MMRLADLWKMLVLLIVRVREADGVLYSNLAMFWPFLDFFHFLIHLCFILDFLCWVTTEGLISKSYLR